jgi:rSAM/selenodomain-associated transferase 1
VTVLLVVAKAPVPGLVKTRLCPPATAAQAADIAAAALLDTIEAVRATPGVTRVLAYAGRLSDAKRASEIRAGLAGWRVLPQRGSDLAERLVHAVADAAAHEPGEPVLLIGMDTPQVHPALLTAAAHELRHVDAVLGPAVDGGWWALGLRDPAHAEALRKIPTSTSSTGRLTWKALSRRQLRVAGINVLSDVDTWADVLTVQRDAPSGRFAATVGALAGGPAR